MNLEQLLIRIRAMKNRNALSQIIHAAESRDGKLSDIEGRRERSRLWDKLMRQGLKVGDMVFIHTRPNITNSRKDGHGVDTPHYTSGTHGRLWAKPLTVQLIRPRAQNIVVRVPGSAEGYLLSPFTCEKLKLSKEPTPEALANALKRETVLKSKNYPPSPGWPKGKTVYTQEEQ